MSRFILEFLIVMRCDHALYDELDVMRFRLVEHELTISVEYKKRSILCVLLVVVNPRIICALDA